MSQQRLQAESVAPEAQTVEAAQASSDQESETAQVAQAALEGLIRHMRARARVNLTAEREDEVELAVSGLDASLLVGKKGQTLDALQYVVNRMVGKRLGERKRVVIDSDGYRERREASLVELARRLSEKARSEGKTVALNPMSARDRRIIHLTLKDEPRVSTRSEGQGEERRLLIIPQQ